MGPGKRRTSMTGWLDSPVGLVPLVCPCRECFVFFVFLSLDSMELRSKLSKVFCIQNHLNSLVSRSITSEGRGDKILTGL